MMNRYIYPTTPVAKKEAMVIGDKFRFTILTSKLVRIEYNEDGYFEDRATQTVVNRDFPVPEFEVEDNGDLLRITTNNIEISYTKEPFSANSLKIRYCGDSAGVKEGSIIGGSWYFGKTNLRNNLKGTVRTLDRVDGACELEDGIMTKGEITALDDSKSLIITENGAIEPRRHESVDQYIFCYGDSENLYDYKGCLKDFYKLTGTVPMIPRYALGNWWSRYHAYTQDEYIELMKRFKRKDVPFSVAVLDIDWHPTKIESKYGTGWTGYTWNKELFPEHEKMLDFLHEEGMEVTLNLHPQEGIAAHEKPYKEMAEAMGINPDTEKTIEFDITDPKFIENYFKILHHPLEDEGVSFWWMDWQQGNTTRVPGLDPLWMLNHYHYLDIKRNGKRPLAFSRYAGPGSHRYPVGFSGDTKITWDSLDFQPYFTATAANIGYGWWSHDIGGHIGGYRDNELMARWVQLGVFSPINRLHSAQRDFLAKEPWRFDSKTEESMKKFLKLRHELIPYLYTMNYRAYAYGEPLIQPMYYKWPDSRSYLHKNEYIFGTEMIVSPITQSSSEATGMGKVKAYLPEGVWFDFFNNRRYVGGRSLYMHRTLQEMPVFVKAGGIIPMTVLQHVNDVNNPENMLVKVFCGADNVFELYEDDGISDDYIAGKYATTKFELSWGKNAILTVNKPSGYALVTHSTRNYIFEFIGIEKFDNVEVKSANNKVDFEVVTEKDVVRVIVQNVSDDIVITLRDVVEKKNDFCAQIKEFIERAEMKNDLKYFILDLTDSNTNAFKFISEISQCDISEDIKSVLYEFVEADNY